MTTAAVAVTVATVVNLPSAHAIVDGGDRFGEVIAGEVPLLNGEAENAAGYIGFIEYEDAMCSFTVIAPHWAMTARHCFEGWGVPAGDTPSGMTMTIAGHEWSWSWTRAVNGQAYWSLGHDIALVKFPFDFNVEKHPTGEWGAPNLPRLPDRPLGFVRGYEYGVIYGWGRTCGRGCADTAGSELHAAGVEINRNYGTDYYGGVTQQVKKSQVDTWYGNDREGARVRYPAGICAKGDSGGPLVVNGVLYGMSSLLPNSDGYCQYTDVYSYVDWIRRTMEVN